MATRRSADTRQAPREESGEEAPEAVPDLARLSPEEIAFLLGGGSEASQAAHARALRAERNTRSNARRTDRRHADPAYAEHLRMLDRERQRRRRARMAPAGPAAPEPAVALPAIAPHEAAERLAAHIRDAATPQARQLRARPELVRRYVAGFILYRLLSADGARPTRGALAAAFHDRFGLELTLSQVQNIRDRIEGFAQPGGPWCAP